MAKTEFMKFAYFDKEIVEFEKATVSIATHSLQYGTTCYTRLMSASKMLGFEYFITWDEFKDIVTELVKKNDIKEDFYMRPFVFCKEPNCHLKKLD